MQESNQVSSPSSPAKLSQLDNVLAELDSKCNRNNAFADFVDDDAVIKFKEFIKRHEKHVNTDPDLRLFVAILSEYRMMAQQVIEIPDVDPSNPAVKFDALDRAAKIYQICKDNYKVISMLQELATKVFKKYSHDGLRIREKYQLSDITIAPIQVLVKYPLLLKEVIKATAPEQTQHVNAVALLPKFSDLAAKVNEFQRSFEKSNSLQSLHGGTLTKLPLESFRDLLSTQGASPSTARMNEQLLQFKEGMREYLANPKSFYPEKKEQLLRLATDLFTDFTVKYNTKKNKEAGQGLSEAEKQDVAYLETNLAILAEFLLTEHTEDLAKAKRYNSAKKEELVKRTAALYSHYSFRLNVLKSKEAEKPLSEKDTQEKQKFESILTILRTSQQTLMKDIATNTTETKTKRLSATLSTYMPAKKRKVDNANLIAIQEGYKKQIAEYPQQTIVANTNMVSLVQSLSRAAKMAIEQNFTTPELQQRLAELDVVTQQFVTRLSEQKPIALISRNEVLEMTQVFISLGYQKPDVKNFRKLMREQAVIESHANVVNVWDGVISAHLPYRSNKNSAVEAQIVGENISITAYIPSAASSSKSRTQSSVVLLKENYTEAKADLTALAKAVVTKQPLQDGQTIRLRINVNKLRMPEVEPNISLATSILKWFGIDADGERSRNENQQLALKALHGELVTVDLPDGKGKVKVKLNITQIEASESTSQQSTPVRLLKLVGVVPNDMLAQAGDMRKYFNQQDKALNVWLNNTQMNFSLREKLGKLLEISHLSAERQKEIREKKKDLSAAYTQLKELMAKSDTALDKAREAILQKEYELGELYNNANEITREKLRAFDSEGLREQITKALRTGDFDIKTEDKQRLQQVLYFLDVQKLYFSGEYNKPENILMFSAMLSRSSEMAGVLQVVDYRSNRDPNNKRAYDLLLVKAEQDAEKKNVPLTSSDPDYQKYLAKHLPELQKRNAGLVVRTKNALVNLWQRIMPKENITLKLSTSNPRQYCKELRIYERIENPLLRQVLTQRSIEKLAQSQLMRVLTIEQISALNKLFPTGELIDPNAFNRNYMTFLKLAEMPDLKQAFMNAQKLHNLSLIPLSPIKIMSGDFSHKINTLDESIREISDTDIPRASLVTAVSAEVMKEQQKLSARIEQLVQLRAQLDLGDLDPVKVRRFIGDRQFITYQQLLADIDKELPKLQTELKRVKNFSEQIAKSLATHIAQDVSPQPNPPAFVRHISETPSLRRAVPDRKDDAESVKDRRVEVSV